MNPALFLVLTLAWAGLVLATAAFHLRSLLTRRGLAVLLLGLPAWLGFVGWLAEAGVIADPTRRPPGAAFIGVPVLLFISLFAVRSQLAGRVAAALPLTLLIGAQAYRIGVELALHQLWLDGLVPRMLTFEGANVDLFIGLTAPVAAWLSTRGRAGLRVAWVWNLLGLLALANVIVRAALTAPGPLNLLASELPNLAVGRFPFTYIAGFLAPLAVLLHVLALRALRQRFNAAPAPG